MAVLASTSPLRVSPFSCMIALIFSRSTTTNFRLLTSSVTKTSCAAAAPFWNHHWLFALLLNSRTAIRGLPLPPPSAAPSEALRTGARTAQRTNVNTRFMVDLLRQWGSRPRFVLDRRLRTWPSIRYTLSATRPRGLAPGRRQDRRGAPNDRARAINYTARTPSRVAVAVRAPVADPPAGRRGVPPLDARSGGKAGQQVAGTGSRQRALR